MAASAETIICARSSSAKAETSSTSSDMNPRTTATLSLTLFGWRWRRRMSGVGYGRGRWLVQAALKRQTPGSAESFPRDDRDTLARRLLHTNVQWGKAGNR